MSLSENNAACAASAKSPIMAALFISFSIAAGAVFTTLDAPIFDEITSGRWLTRSFSEAQERNIASIAALEHKVEAGSTDIDFVAARVSAAVKRNEDAAQERFAEIEARIAGLRERFAALQSRAPEPAAANGDVTGLRSSLHELASAHSGAVAAITRRLDRLEVSAGISTDVMSAVSNPRRVARRNTQPAQKPAAAPTPVESDTRQSVARPERGHMFNIKPVSQQGAPLRVSRLSD